MKTLTILNATLLGVGIGWLLYAESVMHADGILGGGIVVAASGVLSTFILFHEMRAEDHKNRMGENTDDN